MARVLFLTQVLPYPLDSGPRVRQYHMLRHLAGQHQVTLASFVRPDDTPEAVQHLQSFCQAVYTVPMRRSPWRNLRAGAKSLLTGLPAVIVRDEICEMMDALKQVTEASCFDVIHADQLSMALYGCWAKKISPASRLLLDEHNAVYLLARQLASTEANPIRRALMAREARAMAAYEKAMCRAYDAVLTVIPEDRDRLLALFPPAERQRLQDKFAVIPICVDPDRIEPARRPLSPESALTILHMGTMFWPPNVAGVLWFARQVLPRIHRQLPEARFVIVGKSPPPEIRALASDPRVEITGYVGDPSPYIAAADAFVVPLQIGEGMRVKILDAWSWGLPVVSTPVGAEGIQVRSGENIMIAAGAHEFALAVVRVLIDRSLNERLRAAGRSWVEANYAWKTAYAHVDEVYARLLNGKVS